MRKTKNFLTKFLTVSALLGLGMAYSAKADNLTFLNTQVYYVGPSSDGTDNPFGIVNAGGNAISTLKITGTGSAGTLVFNTTGTPEVSLISNTPGLYNVSLYGNNVPAIIAGGTLQTGTYTFSSSSDYFGIATFNGSTGPGSGGGACMTGQTCNNSANPNDVVTINVSSAGVITLQSSSLELATAPTTSGVPEIDPKNGMSAFALLAGAVLIMRGRRKKVQEVAL